MISVRRYEDKDWEMVLGWWNDAKEYPPTKDMMPLESSFIAEEDGTPMLAATVYLTNTKELAWAENFIGNPNLKGEKRREASEILAEFVFTFTKELGYKKIMCLTEKPVLVTRYKELGFLPTLSGLTALIRSL